MIARFATFVGRDHNLKLSYEELQDILETVEVFEEEYKKHLNNGNIEKTEEKDDHFSNEVPMPYSLQINNQSIYLVV